MKKELPEPSKVPRPAARMPPKVSDECETGRQTDRPTDQAPSVMGNGHVVSRLSGGGGRSAEERAELGRSLLYEQNMCTFENFCERRNSQQRLGGTAAAGQETEEDKSDRLAAQDASDGLGNFCTLRRGMRRQEEEPVGGYWTLKRKKLQLNRKFVESFLEDPNAQVVDYLSELDAYLDEIDDLEEEEDEDESDDGCSTGVSEAPEDEEPSVAARGSEEVTGQDQSLQYYQTPGGGGAGDDSAVQADAGGTTGDRVVFGDIKHFCTLPKRKRSQVLSAFKRGASLRRTFVAPTSDSVVPVRKESGAVPEEQSEAVAAGQELSDLQAELEDHRLSIIESDTVLAALEAKVTEQRQKRQGPLRFEQFRAFCHGVVQKCETATAKMRFKTRSLARQNAQCRTLVEQKREAVGSDALRVHLESFELERLAGERELREALASDRELRLLGAVVKRETLQDQEALFDATQQLIRAQQTVDSELAQLQDCETKIEQAERQVAQLEQENERLRQELHGQLERVSLGERGGCFTVAGRGGLAGSGETFRFFALRFRLIAERPLAGLHQQMHHVWPNDTVPFAGGHRLAEHVGEKGDVLTVEKVHLQSGHQIREHLVAHHLEKDVRSAEVGDLFAVAEEFVPVVPERVHPDAEGAGRDYVVGEAHEHVLDLVFPGNAVGDLLLPVVLHHVRATLDDQLEHLAHLAAGPTETESRKGADARQHPISWHRNSMRRKHLIELPEQIVVEPVPVAVEPLGQSLSDSSAIGVPEDGDDFCSISTLPVDDLPNSSMDSEERPAMINVPALRVALPPSPTPSSTWEPSAPPTSSPSPPQPLETDLDGGGWDERVVPRQTGRRTQSQPRLVSITAVRDEATNELVIRTNSVPGDRASAPPLALAEESQVQHQHQAAQQQQHRYGAVESEGSSMGSSRNPSPVSLLSSTTTYSSIASGGDNADNRRSEPNHEAGAGMPSRQSVSNGTQQIVGGGEVATITTADGGSRARHRGEEQWRSTVAVAANDDDGTANEAQAPEEESSDPDVVVDGRRSSRRNDGRPKARWPHAISRSLATTFCTVGLFNVSRFAVFSVHFGANFVVQFVLFSLLFGIPMMWLQMVLGARIRGGPVTMWRISPICKGIGIALLVAQALVALYSAISLAWVLVYFRDAFTVRNEKYRWEEPFEFYRGGGSAGGNQSFRLSDTVADYFNGVVLQRYHLRMLGASQTSTGAGRSSTSAPGVSGIGAIRFQLAFNLAILWTLVFVALCRGIRSLGKVAVGLFLIATAGLVAVCAKFLTFISYDSVQSVFPATDWQDFFLNSRSWMCAAQETFLTWGLLGVSIYSLNCRSNRKGACNGRTRRELRRDAFLVAFITLAVLLLAAVLGSACVQILNTRGYYYFPGSYENLGTNVFLLPASQPLPPQHATMPNRWLIRYSMVVGESFKRPYADPSRESGYQVLRLATELLPAALATAAPGSGHIPAIWGLIAYLTLALFGLGQLCVAWKPIAGAIGDAPSSILLSCVTGLLLGMPLATEGGITIVYYLDTILGAAWWVLLLWIGHILALFLVRGRPFTSDILVNDLKLLQSFSAFVAFAWNFLLPIGLIFLCILQYRLSNSAALFNWGNPGGNGSASYWPLWARQTGGFVQVSFLLLVPIVMVVQIYRYLCRGPPDILDRVDLLLRPPVDGDNGSTARGAVNQARRPAFSRPVQQNSASGRVRSDGSDPNATVSLSLDTRGSAGEDDAPPKYTPPPSYTTATGARIAKMLRNSIRRSVRRLMGESSGGGHRQRVALPQSTVPSEATLGANPAADGELPPDYCSVLQQFGGPESMEMARPPRMLFNSATLGSGRRYRSLVVGTDAESQTVAHSLSSPHHQLTASDVRQILRPATITGAPIVALANTVPAPPPPSAGSASAGFTQTLCNTLLRRGHSMENLVLGAAPIGDSSIITLDCDAEDDRDDAHRNGDAARQNRSRSGMGNDSVI
ncbi:uncharacterized protein LOC128278792 [Anopheles cruzii]|uniref:uncharacterized protein LOC128278792 n=1 Tax=Anopheles cruzii TaxID=68878 RepID=UPI0022EC8D51|nr:uncharacterized protein LOC128278792 [Anopheles cruzii]